SEAPSRSITTARTVREARFDSHEIRLPPPTRIAHGVFVPFVPLTCFIYKESMFRQMFERLFATLADSIVYSPHRNLYPLPAKIATLKTFFSVLSVCSVNRFSFALLIPPTTGKVITACNTFARCVTPSRRV